MNVERLAYFGTGEHIEICDNSGLGINSSITNATIGKDVMMGPDVIYFKNNHRFDRMDIPIREQGNTEVKKLVIKDNVWIGARVILLSGITIGSGAVIGAGSVVTQDVPADSIVAGNPVRIIRRRQGEDKI